MPKRRILVVDDSKVASMTTQMMLRDAYECLLAENGVEGVRRAQDERPDLILMDVVMPEMDGFAACRQIRLCDETNGIPIIMVTTRGEPFNLELGYESGCNDYVTKPVDRAELLRKIENLIPPPETAA